MTAYSCMHRCKYLRYSFNSWSINFGSEIWWKEPTSYNMIFETLLLSFCSFIACKFLPRNLASISNAAKNLHMQIYHRPSKTGNGFLHLRIYISSCISWKKIFVEVCFIGTASASMHASVRQFQFESKNNNHEIMHVIYALWWACNLCLSVVPLYAINIRIRQLSHTKLFPTTNKAP